MNFRRKEQHDSPFPQAFISCLILLSLCDSVSTAELLGVSDDKDRVLVITENSRRSLRFLITADGVTKRDDSKVHLNGQKSCSCALENLY